MANKGFKVTPDAVKRVMDESVVIEIITKRYGIKTSASMDLVEFRETPRTAEESLAEARGEHKGKTRKVAVAEVNKNLFTIRKKLFESTEWQAVKNFDQQTYRWIQERALKSNLRPGMYRLPVALYKEVETYLQDRKAERVPLVAAFVTALPVLQERAALDLGVAYDPNDYAAPHHVQSKFFFDYNFLEEAVPAKLKELDGSAYDREQRKAKESVAREVNAMVEELRAGFASVMSHAVERLTPGEDGKPKQFKASTLENITQFLDLFDGRNLAGDKTLAAQVKECRKVMQGITSKELRTDEAARATVQAAFERINTNMAQMVGDKPNRKIRVMD